MPCQSAWPSWRISISGPRRNALERNKNRSRGGALGSGETAPGEIQPSGGRHAIGIAEDGHGLCSDSQRAAL